ncbi:Protochlorophyllide reductase A, chloroplastic [Seminavis robusta]|uniref:protochlorophyllide reductase n=1 Tax=Seminavis robusta TaxID=568900 RepID=A0A9N8E156_9STRA|nr:Protochlorophyllide reductase A, chloroplastic [Seminavis robusta]|eukprot:Sro543_g163510.1 Protochlorophyllide reductase A, chloroplastic (827) ;mRNA; f:21287-24084
MILRSLLVITALVAHQALAFQFMKGWKVPKRDRAQEAAVEQFGDKKLAVITGASTPLGEKTIQDLLASGEFHVIGAYANADDVQKAENRKNLTPLLCNLESLDSVRDFCSQVHEFRGSKTLDRLVCQAGITCDSIDPVFTLDGHEKTLQVNFLSQYLLASKLLDGMVDSMEARMTLVGDGNTEIADLADLNGLRAGFRNPIATLDGSTSFSAPKACADSVLCQKLLANFLHTKYHKLTGVVFNNLNGISKEELVTELVTGAAGAQSGVSLALDGNTLVDEDTISSEQSKEKAYDIDAAFQLFQLCNELVDTEWPAIKQITSPCPTLKVIGAITKNNVKKEELKRMKQGRPGISEPVEELAQRITKRQRVSAFAQRVVGTILGQTVGRVARFAGKRMLGHVPDTALKGSFDATAGGDATEILDDEDVEEIQSLISEQLSKEKKKDFGDKKLVVMTGTSSGLGRKAALALLRTGDYHVIGAVRDLDKMEAVADVDGFDLDNFTPMYCEMNSFDSVRQFCKNVDEFRGSKPIDRLVCNAGVYQPTLPYAKWSKDGHEQTMQINFLSHFLMISELMTSMEGSPEARVTMVGSVTGNDNTVGGGGVYPIADLHELDGLKAGFNKPIEMADGYGFNGAKAYKDSKLCLMMLANFLHTKYHKTTGIAFSSMYPGCIAESPLFREKRPWFRKYFPIFMKFITGGFVGEHEAGQRLFQVVHDPRCVKSGVYWSWNGGPREGRGAEAIEKGGQISGGGGAGGGWDSIFENDQSSKVLNIDTAYTLFSQASKITGADWPYEQSQHLEVSTSSTPFIDVVPGSTLESATNKNMTAAQS